MGLGAHELSSARFSQAESEHAEPGILVPRVGLEPTRLAATDFESVVYTNFTTEAGADEGGILPQCHLASPIDAQSRA